MISNRLTFIETNTSYQFEHQHNLGKFVNYLDIYYTFQGTNGSELLGTLDEFYDETDQSFNKLLTWPTAISGGIAFQDKDELQLALRTHRNGLKVSHGAVVAQINFYSWTQKMFLDWLFQV